LSRLYDHTQLDVAKHDNEDSAGGDGPMIWQDTVLVLGRTSRDA
jgi:hypothetical protein